MKIIVFSDSHKNSRNMYEVMKRHRSADCFFHLGDGNDEFEFLKPEFPDTAFFSVTGNMEEFGSFFLGKKESESQKAQSELLLDLGGFRFFLTHGHRYNVGQNLSALTSHASALGADIALFGHTHVRYCEYINDIGEKPLYLFNPGSISRPRDGLSPAFGIIETGPTDILFSNASADDLN